MSSFSRLLINSQDKVIRLLGINPQKQIEVDCFGCLIPKGYVVSSFAFHSNYSSFVWKVEITIQGKRYWLPVKIRGVDPHYSFCLFHLSKKDTTSFTKDYPCFRRGKNRNLLSGEIVFVLEPGYFQIGILSSNRYSDCYRGYPAEYCLVTGISSPAPGCALIDGNGNLVGIHYQKGIFISEYSIRSLLKQLTPSPLSSSGLSLRLEDQVKTIQRLMLNCRAKFYEGEWHALWEEELEEEPIQGLLILESFNSSLQEGDVLLLIRNSSKDYEINHISISTILEKCEKEITGIGYSMINDRIERWERKISLTLPMKEAVNV